ncbi:MAG: hypothetical protein WBA90_10395 [Albidovulum sp.]
MLRKMFSLSVIWKMRTDNPATSFRKRPETARERFLSFEEIQRLADALSADPDQRAAGIIRLPPYSTRLNGCSGETCRTAKSTLLQLRTNAASATCPNINVGKVRILGKPVLFDQMC